jgi:hypothetical protein
MLEIPVDHPGFTHSYCKHKDFDSNSLADILRMLQIVDYKSQFFGSHFIELLFVEDSY